MLPLLLLLCTCLVQGIFPRRHVPGVGLASSGTTASRRLTALFAQPQEVREEEVRASLKTLTDTPVGTTKESLKDFAVVDDETMARLKMRRGYASILTEKLFQTIDDFQLASKLKSEGANASRNLAENREKIVILGSGWGSLAFLKTIDAAKYDVTIISPRDHFLFTPMLAASAVGTVDFRSVMEPIRDANLLANYVEATCDAVDAVRKSVHCQTVRCEGTSCEVRH